MEKEKFYPAINQKKEDSKSDSNNIEYSGNENYEKINEIIESSEKIIRSAARQIEIPGLDYEDKAQIGRMAIWSFLKKQEKPEFFPALAKTIARRALLAELRKTKAEKRIPPEKTVYLDDVLPGQGEQEGKYMTFRDLIPVEQENLPEETLEKLKTRNKKAIREVICRVIAENNIPEEKITQKVNYQFFVDNGLEGFLWVFFNNSPFRAINFAYPKKFLPFEMAKAPQGYWKGEQAKERAIEALKYFLERSNYDPKDYPRIVTYDLLIDYGLSAPLQLFNNSPYNYLSAAFPEQKYNPWEMKATPRNYFESKENIIKAVKWLVEDVLGYDIPKMTQKEIWQVGVAAIITKEKFEKNGLNVLMKTYPSPEPLLKIVYPNKFLPWDFPVKKKWMGKQGKELAARATRWIIEDLNGLPPSSEKITYDFFIKNRLRGMLTSRSLGFNSSPKAALKNAYPDLFSK